MKRKKHSKEQKFRIFHKYNWGPDCIITESIWTDESLNIRRYTATICGYRNWKLYQGKADNPKLNQFLKDKCNEIKQRILAGDKTIFNEPNQFKTEL